MFGPRRYEAEDEPRPLPISIVDEYAEARGMSYSEAVSCPINIGAFVTERLDAGHEFFLHDGGKLTPVDWDLPPIQNDSGSS